MSQTISVQIDYDRLRDIAMSGVRRASVFLAIGTNAARIDPPIRHVLDESAQFSFVPHEVTLQNSKHFIDEFEDWIISNGFRDLVETFSLFLVNVFAVHFIIERGVALVGDRDKAVGKFERYGVLKQLEVLTELLKLDSRFDAMFASLNQARNCMAHRLGIVGDDDLPAPDTPFVLRWRTRSMVLEDGTDVTLALIAGQSPRVEKVQKLLFAEVERERPFVLGEHIRLTRHDLAEICFGVTIATSYVLRRLIEFARSKGHTVVEKNPSDKATEA